MPYILPEGREELTPYSAQDAMTSRELRAQFVALSLRFMQVDALNIGNLVPFSDGRAITAGDLNYQLTCMADGYLAGNLNYQAINDVLAAFVRAAALVAFAASGHPDEQLVDDTLGALEGARLELYRRIAAPYEDTKIALNGDVYVTEVQP